MNEHSLTWNEFTKVDMRVGTITSAVLFEKVRNPAFILEIDFGSLGIMKSSAQITHLYQATDLINQQIIAVVNFPPKQIANMMSECLVMGVLGNEKDVILIQPDRKITNGLKIG